ncbi:hypothetical protein EDM80_06760 [bacterium]|nr:MAG: hypothetical protein EDM80_06760 [bacterium]
MRGRTLMAALILVTSLALGGAWLVFGSVPDIQPSRPGEDPAPRIAATPELEAAAPSPPPPALKTNPAVREAARREGSPAGSRAGGTEQPDDAASGTSPGNGPQPARPQGPGTVPPAPSRAPTPAEREEAARQNGGRAAYRARLEASAPDNGKAEAALRKSPKAEEWTQQWRDEGIDPPEMVPTQVSGKMMSPLSREGIAQAKVGILTFFPVNGQRGGSIWPVVTELVADAQGNFSGEVPASPTPPLYYPPAALCVSAENYRVLAGTPVLTFVAGQLNALGIFWAPETPFAVECDGSQFEGSLEVVCTGELDPQRWHPQKRGATLAYFPRFALPAPKPESPSRVTKLTSNWDERDTPFVTLMSTGGPLQTKRCAHARKQSSKRSGESPQVQEPFEPVVFEAAGFAEISGQVVDAQGAGIPNATVYAAGDNETPSVLSDSLGFFRFEKPPKKTSLLAAAHEDYITTTLPNVTPGTTGARIVFNHLKPVIRFRLRDQLTQQFITSISVKLFKPDDPKSSAIPKAFQVLELSSAAGDYFVKSEALLGRLTLEKVGYFPLTVLDPVATQAQQSGEWTLWLNPGRKLEVRPRDHSGTERADRWFSEPDKPDDPAIWTYWSQHWIEYTLDFGAAPEPGIEGGHFDLVLGCRNQGIVDNNYQFQVKVFVDDTERGTLTILANTLTEQFGRLSLGQLSGIRRIRLVWQNDSWIPDQLDANIRYQSLKFVEQPGP